MGHIKWGSPIWVLLSVIIPTGIPLIRVSPNVVIGHFIVNQPPIGF